MESLLSFVGSQQLSMSTTMETTALSKYSSLDFVLFCLGLKRIILFDTQRCPCLTLTLLTSFVPLAAAGWYGAPV